jgi:Na+-transporting NADH:ubiquinone oxidoreductase subunit A
MFNTERFLYFFVLHIGNPIINVLLQRNYNHPYKSIMVNVIKIKKGLDIHLKGKASEVMLQGRDSDAYALVPDVFDGISPKVVVKAGDKVKAGTPLMTDKLHPEMKFVSSVSGEVAAVNRGEKRKVLSIVVKPDATQSFEEFGVKDVSKMKPEEIKESMLAGGVWPFIRQRPYDFVASPDTAPRDIFVSTYYSAPLAPNFEFIVKGQENDFRTGLDALSKLTAGKVYVGVKAGSQLNVGSAERVEIDGPHPAGNVGVLINHVKPINKGETVWTVRPDDVIVIGRLFNKGVADFTRLVAITGSETTERGYIKTVAGCTIKSLTEGKLLEGKEHLRIISGNVLTGRKVTKDDYLLPYDNQITVIPEGDEINEFVGWAAPRLNEFSVSHSYFSWLFGSKKEYSLDARIKGGKRAMIMSNEYDKVFPMDILPEYLLKAIIAFDIDKMEALGIYEVAPEDFALCEFVDTSKIEIQKLVRTGLNQLYKELN